MRGYSHAQRRDLLFVSPAIILSYIARPRGWPIQARVWLDWGICFFFLSFLGESAIGDRKQRAKR
jgi:hypothetical protein